MDEPRIDQLARVLRAPGNRRRLLTLLSALPLAGALNSVLDDEGEARRGATKPQDPQPSSLRPPQAEPQGEAHADV